MQFGVNNTPEYKAMNPNGLVPTIDDDGFILWESHAIVRYLARKHGSGTLWPDDARTAADADRWMEWYNTTLWPNVRPIFRNLVRTPPEKRNMARGRGEPQEARRELRDRRRAARGPRLPRRQRASRMGDIPMGVAAYRWFNLPIERPLAAELRALVPSASRERPAFRAALHAAADCERT